MEAEGCRLRSRAGVALRTAAVEALPTLRLGQSSVAPTVAPDAGNLGPSEGNSDPLGLFGQDRAVGPESEEILEKQGNFIVGGTELESVTSTMSTECLTNKTLVFPAFLTIPTLYKSHKSHQFSCEKGRQKGTKIWLRFEVISSNVRCSPALPRRTSRDIVTPPRGATMATRRSAMGRPKFRITVDNLMHAARYLDGRLGSLGLIPRTMSVQEARQVVTEILISPRSDSAADRLQSWCDTNLDAKSWLALQTAIRKRRQRAHGNNFRVVTLSAKAYELLHRLANRDQVTLSDALQRTAERSLKSKRK
jgi:macrodomain Ter protein organizer (MatP/YcbG family)